LPCSSVFMSPPSLSSSVKLPTATTEKNRHFESCRLHYEQSCRWSKWFLNNRVTKSVRTADFIAWSTLNIHDVSAAGYAYVIR
jgi:hypothetical protein